MQGLVVAFIVAAAAVYAAWQLMPQRMRSWLVGRMMAVAPSSRAWLTRLEADSEAGGCRSCKGCATDRQPPSPPGPAKIEVHRRAGS